MRRHTTVLSALALAAGGLTLTAAPARAAASASVTLDIATAGHITGSVTTDAPVVKVYAGTPGGGKADGQTLYPEVTAEAPTATVPFDLETWGLTDGEVRVETCEADESGCVPADAEAFTPVDVTPTITWPAETTTTSTSYTVSASDPDGGGVLLVGFDEASTSSVMLPRNGTPVTLDLEGPGEKHLHVSRCSENLEVCRLGETRTVTVEEPEPVDTTPPAIASLTRSRSTVYPTPDGYQDTVRFRIRPQVWSDTDTARLEVRNGAGDQVRALTPYSGSEADGYQVSWDGRDDAGALLPAGAYTARAVLTDAADNSSTAATSVQLVRQHLTMKTFTKSVTPGASYAKQILGACSYVKRPSLRGWSGSYGLYSNAKCTRDAAASKTETHHGMNVPKAVMSYGDFTVTTYGGASTRKPTSTMTQAYYGNDNTWGTRRAFNSSLTSHPGYVADGDWAVHPTGSNGPWVYWSSFTNGGSWYDIKSFTVSLQYDVLVND